MFNSLTRKSTTLSLLSGRYTFYSISNRGLQTKPLKVLFFGSDILSAECLNHLAKNKGGIIEKLEVVCPPDKPKGRNQQLASVPVKEKAKELVLNVHEVPVEGLRGWKVPGEFDVGVVVSFGYFIPRLVINSFPFSCINLHPSFLPKYRGAAPIQHALINGDKEIGVSVITVSPITMDGGDILWQKPLKLDDDITYTKVLSRVMEIGSEGLLDVLKNIDSAIKNRKTQVGEIVMASKITKEKGNIQWEHQTVKEIFNLWRAIGETVGVTSLLTCGVHKNLKVKLVELRISTEREKKNVLLNKIGDAEFKDGVIIILCKDDMISVSSIHIEGKKKISASQFQSGYLNQVEKSLFKFHSESIN